MSLDAITIEIVEGWLNEPPRIRAFTAGSGPAMMKPKELPAFIREWALSALGDMIEDGQIPGVLTEAAREDLARLAEVQVLD